jgi:hypothetical protein
VKQVIFTLASARSGTLYLRSLVRLNTRGCVCRHEPFFDWGNPTMLGPAIYDAYAGRLDQLRARLARKREYIERLPGKAYLESSHAFLKSAYRVALELFPELQLIHLIRDPLKVAKSEAWREAWRRRLHAPFHYYRGDDGRRHFYWALTTNEDIFRAFDVARLSLFQRYLIQWIELENRAMAFLEAHQLHQRCFTLQAPGGLNDPACIRAMLEFLGLTPAHPNILMGGRTNKSWGRTTVITAEDEQACEEVLRQLPARYLEIFGREPYATQRWSARLRRAAGGGCASADCIPGERPSSGAAALERANSTSN